MPRQRFASSAASTSGPSLSFWVAACYMVLFIIRPWERLIPELGDWKFERIFVAIMLVAVFRDGLTFRGQYKSVLAFFGVVVLSAMLAQKP